MSKVVKKPRIAKTKLAIRKKSKDNPHFSSFIYGDSRAGKTFLARSLVEDKYFGKVLFLSCDASDDTVDDLVSETFNVVDNVDLEVLESVYEMLVNDDHDYKTVFLDGVSHLYFKTLDIARVERLKKESSTLHLKYNAFSSVEAMTLDQRDYGTARQQLLKLLFYFVDLPLNFISTSLSKQTAHGKPPNQTYTTEPNFSGVLYKEWPSKFKVVGNLVVKKVYPKKVGTGAKAENKRILQLAPSTEVPICGIRNAHLDIAEMVDPTFPKLRELLPRKK